KVYLAEAIQKAGGKEEAQELKEEVLATRNRELTLFEALASQRVKKL
ncbi:MAG: hypothetical protein HY561_13440, partial [Gemmatimonadetes bacterium]|nr:hypothetical protein [Gemmatimonadota bacterium]